MICSMFINVKIIKMVKKKKKILGFLLLSLVTWNTDVATSTDCVQSFNIPVVSDMNPRRGLWDACVTEASLFSPQNI